MDPLWVSVVVTIVLVCITAYYALETRRIASAAAEQAQELRQQRISASQPIVWPMIVGWKIYRLAVHLENIGNGPALDIDIHIVRGETPISNEHVWYSYFIPGEKKEHSFLEPATTTPDSYGQPTLDIETKTHIAGNYTLFVEWHDLYKSGPFFQAKLPFSLEMDTGGTLHAKEGVVAIDRIPEKTLSK